MYLHMWVQVWVIIYGIFSDPTMNPGLEVLCELIQ